MQFQDVNVAVLSPANVFVSGDDLYFGVPWGRLLDSIAKRCKHVYTCGRVLPPNSSNICAHRLESDNISVDLLPPWKSSMHDLFRAFKIGYRCCRLAKNADIIFIRGFWPGWLMVLLYCYLRKIPICQQLATNPLKLLLSHKRFVWWRHVGSILYTWFAYKILDIARKSARFHIICNGTELSKVFPGPRTHAVVSGSLSKDEFYVREDTCTGSKINFIFVGLLRPEKGLCYLLEALAKLRIEKPWKLTIVGNLTDYPQEVEKLKSLADILHIENSIIWYGHAHFGPELFDILKSSDLFVFPTLSEGTPRVLVEARAFGLPVISTDVGGIPDSVTNGVDAILVPPHNPDMMREAIERVISDLALRRNLIQAGYERARQLTIENFSNEVLEVMASQLSSKQP